MSENAATERGVVRLPSLDRPRHNDGLATPGGDNHAGVARLRAQVIVKSIQRLFGTTMVVVTHELDSIREIADRVVMIADGHIEAIGTVENLSRSPNDRVRNFFARTPPAPDGTERTMLSALVGGISESTDP